MTPRNMLKVDSRYLIYVLWDFRLFVCLFSKLGWYSSQGYEMHFIRRSIMCFNLPGKGALIELIAPHIQSETVKRMKNKEDNYISLTLGEGQVPRSHSIYNT